MVPRSCVNEAAPMVTGKLDEATIALVFAAHRNPLVRLERFNPYIELDLARRERDRVCQNHGVKPGHLIAPPAEPDPDKGDDQLIVRRRAAQEDLIDYLIGRTWSVDMVLAHFGTPELRHTYDALAHDRQLAPIAA